MLQPLPLLLLVVFLQLQVKGLLSFGDDDSSSDGGSSSDSDQQQYGGLSAATASRFKQEAKRAAAASRYTFKPSSAGGSIAAAGSGAAAAAAGGGLVDDDVDLRVSNVVGGAAAALSQIHFGFAAVSVILQHPHIFPMPEPYKGVTACTKKPCSRIVHSTQ